MQTGVLIVGAGPVGLTLANELARRQVPCRIIDRGGGPAATSRALVIHQRTLELLQGAGLGDQVREAGIPVLGMMFSRAGRDISQIPFGARGQAAVSIPQQETERVLRDALQARGVGVEWSTELTELAEFQGGVRAVAGGRSFEAAFVAGCDGAHSAVRHLAGIQFEGQSLPETILMADAELDWDVTPDHAHQFLHREGAISAIPMPGGVWRLAAMPLDASTQPDQEFFEGALVRRSGHRPRRMRLRWTSAFNVNCRLAAGYRSGRLLLAGDAAHIHSPVGGQGMNVGMQDAFNLGWKLAAVLQGWRDTLLDTYQLERRPVAAGVIRANARVTRLLMSKNPVRAFVRDHLMPQALRLPAVSNRARLEATGLGVHYSRSPLSGSGGGAASAIAGCGGTGWALVTEEGRSLVVRPDGYVAAALPKGDGAFERYWSDSMVGLGAPAASPEPTSAA